MKVYLETSIKRYLDRVEDLLLEQEANNNLMLGLLERGKNNIGIFTDGIHLGIVEEEGKVVYAFMQTPPNKWILPKVDSKHDGIIPAVAQFLKQHHYPVPGVLGPEEYAGQFVDVWKDLTGKQARKNMEQLIYQLDEVKVNPQEDGRLIQAEEKHESLVGTWLMIFGEQVNMQMDKARADSMAKSFIQKQSLYFWEKDGEIVSMANNSRNTRNGASVNAVFTSDEHKRKGYATSVVAALSQKLLDNGAKFCSLYTDLANPTSNSIYKKIGYEVVGDSVEYLFD